MLNIERFSHVLQLSGSFFTAGSTTFARELGAQRDPKKCTVFPDKCGEAVAIHR
jgi:hypothetical protein